MSSKIASAVAGVVSIIIPSVQAQSLPTVIFSDITTSSTSAVPGLAGASFTAFDRPFASPDGTRWILSADTDLAFAVNEVILVGGGLSGTLAVQEGTPVVAGGTENVGPIDQSLSINNASSYTYATNTDAATTADEVIVKFNAGTGLSSVVAREGDPLPAPFATEAYGVGLNGSRINTAGDVSFIDTGTVGPLPATSDSFVFLNGSPAVQEGVTVPLGQAGGATAAWQVFDFQDVQINAAGSSYILQGDTDDADLGMDDIVAVDNVVVVQESNPVPGFSNPSPVSVINEIHMDAAGDWMVRGSLDDGDDFLIRNGLEIAKNGTSVPGGRAGELFDDLDFGPLFYTMGGNGVGDFFYGAVTDDPNSAQDGVIVVNIGGIETVLLRQGDELDLNNDGLGDGLFIDTFGNDDNFLTPAGLFYGVVTLVDSAGTAAGDAFFAIDALSVIPEPASLGLLAAGGLLLGRRRRSA